MQVLRLTDVQQSPLLVVETIGVAPGRFRLVEREVRGADQRLDVRVVGFEQGAGLGDADADADADRVAFERDRLAEHVEQLVAQPQQDAAVLGRQNGGEFVTCQPHRQTAQVPEGMTQSVCDRAQHRIAAGVAVGIVDALEVIEIHEDHRGRLRLGQNLLELLVEMAPVGQAGKLVVIGEVVGLSLGLRTLLPGDDLAPQQQHRRHRDDRLSAQHQRQEQGQALQRQVLRALRLVLQMRDLVHVDHDVPAGGVGQFEELLAELVDVGKSGGDLRVAEFDDVLHRLPGGRGRPEVAQPFDLARELLAADVEHIGGKGEPLRQFRRHLALDLGLCHDLRQPVDVVRGDQAFAQAGGFEQAVERPHVLDGRPDRPGSGDGDKADQRRRDDQPAARSDRVIYPHAGHLRDYTPCTI